MPANFIFDIDKENFIEILKKKAEKTDLKLKLTIPVEISLNDNFELESLINFLENNQKLEYLKINLPGSFTFNELLTEELIKEQVPNLKITIQEKIDNVATTNFNEFL